MARAKKAKTDGGKAKEARPRDYSTLLKPIVSEKTSALGGKGGGVAFKVIRTATKPEIKEAVERVFKVEVAAVRTANYMGKAKRTMRSAGRRANFKKAYITLKEGHTIDLIEGI